MINGLNMRAKTIKLSEENIALCHHDLGLGSEFLDMILKVPKKEKEKEITTSNKK